MLKIIKTYLKKIFRRPINIKKSWVEEPSQYSDIVSFLNWFDKTSSLENTKSKAETDWGLLIANFPEYDIINKNNSLEIGFGGGRLLVQAANNFKNVYGVDIHNSFDKTREYLSLNNINNSELVKRENINKLKNGTFDFIYSFIVFQHFNSFSEVDFYLSEIKRLLAPNGCCHIFFAKSEKNNFKEVDPYSFEKRRCSLFVNPAYFRKHLEKNFNIISYSDALPKNTEMPVTPDNIGNQARILFKLK